MSHWKFYLAHDYAYHLGKAFSKTVNFQDENGKTRLRISQDGLITVFKGYAWDGCSPKLRVFDWCYIGAPDGTVKKVTGKPKTYFASLIHDALYQFMDHPEMPLTRKEMDKLFLALMQQSRFSLRGVYYLAVRTVGGAYHALMKGVRFLRFKRPAE